MSFVVGKDRMYAPDSKHARMLALKLIQNGEPCPIQIRSDVCLYAWVEYRTPVKSNNPVPVYFRRTAKFGATMIGDGQRIVHDTHWTKDTQKKRGA